MKELLPFFQSRCGLYVFLSRVFETEIDGTFLEKIRSMDFTADYPSEAMKEGAAKLGDWLKNPGGDPLTDLAVDYARIFIGAGATGGKAAYPYESVYTSPQGLVMQEAWEKVCAIYRRHGLARKEHSDIHEDHIALELDFMAQLCRDAMKFAARGDSEAVTASLEAQASFLEDHLLNWTKGFARDVERYAEKPFYPAVAQFMRGFLIVDGALLKDLLQELKNDGMPQAEA